ncbi:PREDICTED: heterogeneous nuclear ribonucleoprotein A3 homolog 1-like [Ceratosolen solmsi marchali]|uniref:Heterogeneous nuclear ribonucleoprotein A3 homolog 1-like n=1 Tax=Ceratosolen solmsi marchali TaxID=326594 RepID=A0AAJ6VN39_9HYME|nr:PREDICTED: heterogeneous nuclear ribonucleoprotein A3 homolog 1-like [Ceratosolen solmsi marchali]
MKWSALVAMFLAFLAGGWGLGRPGLPDSGVVVVFPKSTRGLRDTVLRRKQRSVNNDYEDYGDDGGPEARHFKRKLKYKFRPNNYGLGYGGFGCRKLHGCGGFGGWHQPHYGGGPVAAAFAGSGHGYGGHYGGWNPGWNYGGGLGGGFGRPGPHSQVASWNIGPFQGAFGYAHAG